MRILLIVVALIGIAWTLPRFRVRRTWRVAFGWSAMWLLVIGVAVVPEGVNRLADMLGIGRGADVVLYGAVLVILAICFRLAVRVEELDRSLTTITRALALRDRDSHDGET
jgi:small membrane protein